mmetsp:Transcript_6688/g.15154  ORF Transcript_6688/g.15154 Transcript_6688/m.15154 type:complete len:228 (-) Transcript_6688:236-919(-)
MPITCAFANILHKTPTLPICAALKTHHLCTLLRWIFWGVKSSTFGLLNGEWPSECHISKVWQFLTRPFKIFQDLASKSQNLCRSFGTIDLADFSTEIGENRLNVLIIGFNPLLYRLLLVITSLDQASCDFSWRWAILQMIDSPSQRVQSTLGRPNDQIVFRHIDQQKLLDAKSLGKSRSLLFGQWKVVQQTPAVQYIWPSQTFVHDLNDQFMRNKKSLRHVVLHLQT